jgi:hypothetical protein
VPWMTRSASISTFMSLRKRSPGMGISSRPVIESERVEGNTAQAVHEVGHQCGVPHALVRMTYEARSIAYLCEPPWHTVGTVAFVSHASAAADTTLTSNYIGGRGRYRTADRWCVKPVLYH